MKIKVIITILAILILCGVNPAQADVVNPNSVVVNDIAYYFQTDKFVYNLDEEVEMLFRVTNLTEYTVNFGKTSIPPFCYTFIVTDENNNEIWYWPRTVPLPPPMDYVLGPYESRQNQQIWNMMNDNGTTETNDDFPVEPGLYNVTGYLRAGEIIPVSVSIEIIPEPTTVFLLGFGGLLLRKRI